MSTPIREKGNYIGLHFALISKKASFQPKSPVPTPQPLKFSPTTKRLYQLEVRQLKNDSEFRLINHKERIADLLQELKAIKAKREKLIKDIGRHLEEAEKYQHLLEEQLSKKETLQEAVESHITVQAHTALAKAYGLQNKEMSQRMDVLVETIDELSKQTDELVADSTFIFKHYK